MINTTDFLDALRYFEKISEEHEHEIDFKIKVKKDLLNELEFLKYQIIDVDLGDYTEVIEGTNEALKNL